MKLRMTLLPENTAVGTLLSPTARQFSIQNNEDLPATLTKYAKREGEGVVHEAPLVPHVLGPGEEESHSALVTPDGPTRINAALQFDWEFEVQPLVDARNGYGPMIYNGLITNAYHPEIGRGGYFHENSGTSEGQAVFIYAAFLAYEALRGRPDAQYEAQYYRDLAISMTDAMGDGDDDGPMIRQEFPEDPNTITLLHWLFAGKGPVNLQGITLDYVTNVSGGRLTIPASRLDQGIRTVFQIYPASQALLYPNPFSPVVGGNQILINESQWSEQSNGDVVINVGGVSGAYKVVFSYFSSQVIPLGTAYEAYPAWQAIPPGYSACAPDTFRWLDMALARALQFGRPSDKSNLAKLKAGLKRTVVKGQNLTDLREVLKPQPKIAVPDIDGFFCFAMHPVALTPPGGSGLDPGWVGYNFWRRDELTGDIIGDIPEATSMIYGAGDLPGRSQVQIGRGFEDSWRSSTTYQDPDQFLYVELGTYIVREVPFGDESLTGFRHPPKVRIFVSTTREYDVNTRYLTDVDDTHFFSRNGGNLYRFGWLLEGNLQQVLIGREAFVNAQGQPLPVDSVILNFGIQIENFANIAYQIRIRNMRLVSGASRQWVFDNFDQAIAGTQLPYFPGAIPFATNADLKAQEFVGYNGNPFHGYQLPDLWLELEEDARIIHGTLTPKDLPLADINTGAITHPMSMTNANGLTKPAHIALMEQQCLFLRDAQEVWVRDQGFRGPWAHTFVLNTPARFNIGGPAPHTWVYTNDDPNTRWVGYQVRIVESLAYLVWRTRNMPEAQDVHNLCRDMTIDWLRWLDGAWPNLNGTVVGGVRLYGMPTDFRPGGQPTTEYEETHAPAIILRGCMFLKMTYPTGEIADLCDALMVRCWEYMEMNWRTTGELAFTWSPDPEGRQWYGFWHGEIIWTISDMLLLGESVRPPQIPRETLYERLMLTVGWMEKYGIVDAKHRLAVPLTGLRAANLEAPVNWDAGFETSQEFRTEILKSENGNLVKGALRDTPRKTLTFNADIKGDMLRRFRASVSRWQDREFVAASVERTVPLAESLPPGSAAVRVSRVEPWMRAGEIVMLMGPQYEARVIEDVVGDEVRFTWTSRSSFPVGSKIAPGLLGYLNEEMETDALTNTVGQVGIQFQVTPAQETTIDHLAVETYRGIPVWPWRPNWRDNGGVAHVHPVRTLDTGKGVPVRVTDVKYPVYRLQHTYTGFSREQVADVEQFFRMMRGRQKNWWLPTGAQDLVPAVRIAQNSDRLIVSNPDDVRLYFDPRTPSAQIVHYAVLVRLKDGQQLINRVLDVTLSESEGELLLDRWPRSIELDEIAYCCWLMYGAFSSDGLTTRWLSDQVAEIRVSFDSEPLP